MRKVLEVAVPLITSYPMIANRFAILGIDTVNAQKYLSNNYINLIAIYNMDNKENYMGTFIDTYLKSFYENCPLLEYSGVIRHTVLQKYEKLTDFIENAINKGYYLYLILNNYFLKCSHSYNKNHRMHDTFIYGYDKDKKIVMVADFYNFKYTNSIASYDEVNNSFLYYFYDPEYPGRQMGDIITQIKLTKAYNDIVYDININGIRQQLENYINSCNNCEILLEGIFYEQYLKKYGLNYYETLNVYLVDTGRELDHRWAYTLLDHKRAWLIRLKCLESDKFINQNTYLRLESDFQKLFNSTKIILNNILKFNILNNDKLLSSINDKCSRLREEDERIMRQVLKIL